MTPIELDFGALSIDNDILKSEGYKFDEGILAQFSAEERVKISEALNIMTVAVKELESETIQPPA